MLTGPSLIGHIVPQLPPNRRKRRAADRARRPGLGKLQSTAVAPLGTYKKLVTHSPESYGNPQLYVQRRCFIYCDKLYQLMPADERLVWRQATKRPGISPYDLWMKESMTLTLQGLCPPDVPSISGGWATGKVIEGTTHPPAPCFAGPRLRSQVMWISRGWGIDPAPEGWHILKWTFIAPPPPPESSSYFAINFGWNPDTATWTHQDSFFAITTTYTRPLYEDEMPVCLWTYAHKSPGRTRRYHGRNRTPGTWSFDCAEQPRWSGPPPLDWPDAP